MTTPTHAALTSTPFHTRHLEENSTFASALVTGDRDLQTEVLEHAWREVLAPAYLATRQKRIVPNIAEDYFVRAEARLHRAADLGLLPAPDSCVSIDTDGDRLNIDGGWGPLLDDARERVALVAPPFSTFVHGDPNPENILWDRSEAGQMRIRLIDPKDWRNGDYLFDAAKIGHYLRVTSPVEDQRPSVKAAVNTRGTTIEYRRQGLETHHYMENRLLDLVAATACDADLPDSESWHERYELAIAANLLGIVGPRLERGSTDPSSTDNALGWIAFAEGLRSLASPETARS